MRRTCSPHGAGAGALQRGMDWMVGMQSKDGGWGAFDADNTRELAYKLPFCDFGAVIDPPSADVTAHVVEALAAEGLADTTACRRGVDWLLRAQEADGSWFGRWGCNYVYGVGAVVPALIAAGRRGVVAGDPAGHPLAGGPPERRRRLGRGHALLRRPGLGRAAANRPRRRRRGRCWRCWPASGEQDEASSAGIGVARLRIRPLTAPGTSRSSPAPASRATSTSTITCTGTSFRCRRWAGTAERAGRTVGDPRGNRQGRFTVFAPLRAERAAVRRALPGPRRSCAPEWA